MDTLSLRVLYFALVRERLRRNEDPIQLSVGSTVADLMEHLCSLHPELAGLRPILRIAVNQAFVESSEVLRDGDEVALIPPVAGGAPHVRLSEDPLDLSEAIRAVTGPAQGAVVTFVGTVRAESHGKAVLRLVYEAYGAMALRTLDALARELEAELPGVRIAAVHRLGTLACGEAAVMIAASAPHRADAFIACQRMIDRLKEETPIWKKEVFADGEMWVGSRP